MGLFAAARLLAACSHVQFHADSRTCHSSGSEAKKKNMQNAFCFELRMELIEKKQNKGRKRLSKDKAGTLNICEQQQQQQKKHQCDVQRCNTPQPQRRPPTSPPSQLSEPTGSRKQNKWSASSARPRVQSFPRLQTQNVWKRHKVSRAVVDSNLRDVSTALGSDALMKQSRFN